MEAREVKQYIYDNKRIESILTELEMHHIKWHNVNEYISCGMPDGDNIGSTIIYNTPNLKVTAYTRDIVDPYGVSDIISLVCFIKKMNFSEALMWLCNLLGLDYYHVSPPKDPVIQYLKMRNKFKSKKDEDEIPLQPLDEIILRQYMPYPNQEFIDDNIDYYTQKEFEIGWDMSYDWDWFPRHRYSIPIRDELGTLVGVKGRRTSNTEFHGKIVDDIRAKEEPKYIYMYPCAKAQILYGLYKTKDYIKEKNEVIICESEKGVMQLWSNGYRNAVGIGGHQLSASQAEKIIRLGATVVIAFDKDVKKDIIYTECMKLINFCKNVYYIYDFNNILEDKESPMDNPEKWEELYKNKKMFIKSI